MKKFLTLTISIFVLSFYSPIISGAPEEAENAIHFLKLGEYLSKRGGEIVNLDDKKILVNILSHLSEIKIQEFTDFIKVPFHAKFLRAIYAPHEKEPEVFKKFILNPRPLLNEDRLILTKKIDDKIHFTAILFLEELIASEDYHNAQINPRRYKIDSTRYEKLLNHFYYRLNDFKGSELQFALKTMLDSKGEKIIRAVGETMIMFLKDSQKVKKNDQKN